MLLSSDSLILKARLKFVSMYDNKERTWKYIHWLIVLFDVDINEVNLKVFAHFSGNVNEK
jgi:hypothetical protein